MKELIIHPVPPALFEAKSVLLALQKAGHDAYIVGGAVRDAVLQIEISDVDIATSATPAEVMSIFEKTIPTGLQHGTVTVIVNKIAYEVTTFRTEATYSNYRKPESVQFVKHLIEDLQRRDFTMNAMALNEQFVCIDPFNGIEHLKAGILRTVGNSKHRFQEDALRMLRALRFLTTYELMPALSLWRAISQHKQFIQHIAMERVSNELEKIMQSRSVIRGLSLLTRSGILQLVKSPLYFAEKLKLYKQADWYMIAQVSDVEARWAMLLWQCELNAEQRLADVQHLKFSKKRMQKVLQLAALQQLMAELEQMTLEVWLKVLEQFGKELCELWLRELAPIIGLHDKIVLLHQSLCIYEVNKLAIKGSDLIKWTGKRGGPWVQQYLSRLFKQVATGQLANDKHVLKKYIVGLKGGECSECKSTT